MQQYGIEWVYISLHSTSKLTVSIHPVFGKGRAMETMAHSDFKCLIRKCLMETVSHYIFLAIRDTFMYDECPSVSGLIENFANET